MYIHLTLYDLEIQDPKSNEKLQSRTARLKQKRKTLRDILNKKYSKENY